MTQEEKKLFLRDLCARLLYGIIGHYYLNKSTEWGEPEKLINIDLIDERLITEGNSYCIEEFIPYLRPMSSMTEEEKIESLEFAWEDDYGRLASYNEDISKYIDWLNSHHFDYRGLIEMGLAIEVTPENNPYENR